MDSLDRHFSRFIRLRDSDENGYGRCCTCGKRLFWKDAHCGHFISRRHRATRTDEQNCALQCAGCNTFNQGRQYEFSLYIDQRYGKGTADRILVRSRQLSKVSSFDKKVIAKKYKELADKMEKELTP